MSTLTLNAPLRASSSKAEWLKAALISCLIGVVLLLAFVDPVFATTPSGGTGTSATMSTRVTTVANSFYSILQAIGVVVLTSAFLYVGYSMAFGGKKWSDVANVAYGCLIAGAGSILVGWLFQ